VNNIYYGLGGEWLTVVIDNALRRQLLNRYRSLLNPRGTKDRKWH